MSLAISSLGQRSRVDRASASIAMAIFVPVAGTFSILVFYAFVNELYGKRVSCVKRNSCVEFSEAKVIKRVQTIGRDLHYQGAQVAWVKIEHF